LKLRFTVSRLHLRTSRVRVLRHGVLCVAALALAALGSAAARAAQSPAKPAGDDLRAVYASAADVADGKRVAEATCVRCHGASGISAIKTVPNLAGQRPAYLHAKLRAYQAGLRSAHEMQVIVKFLNDDALMKVAAYYGSLEPAQFRPVGRTRPSPQKTDALAAGKAAAQACSGCHGEAGVTAMAGTPSLVGLDPRYFIAAIAAYKSGQRKSDVMQPLTAALNDADLKALALHYALQKPARAATPAQGDANAGKAGAAACSGCHGEQGVSATPTTPSLAGQDAQYQAAALHAYKDGSRKDETMKGVASGLDEATMKNVSAYFAAQAPRAPKVEKPLTLAEWVQRCERCHGVNGNSTDPRVPALAAQREDYLVQALQSYRSGARKEAVMSAMAASLTESDVAALASYYARQKARAFVFVAVPAR
jgi:cytochrome c553